MTDEKQPENTTVSDDTNQNNTQEEEIGNPADIMEVGAYAAGGAAAGMGMSVLGGIKLAVAGTVVGGMLPVAAVGAVTGIAAYGLKKTFWDK